MDDVSIRARTNAWHDIFGESTRQRRDDSLEVSYGDPSTPPPLPPRNGISKLKTMMERLGARLPRDTRDSTVPQFRHSSVSPFGLSDPGYERIRKKLQPHALGQVFSGSSRQARVTACYAAEVEAILQKPLTLAQRKSFEQAVSTCRGVTTQGLETVLRALGIKAGHETVAVNGTLIDRVNKASRVLLTVSRNPPRTLVYSRRLNGAWQVLDTRSGKTRLCDAPGVYIERKNPGTADLLKFTRPAVNDDSTHLSLPDWETAHANVPNEIRELLQEGHRHVQKLAYEQARKCYVKALQEIGKLSDVDPGLKYDTLRSLSAAIFKENRSVSDVDYVKTLLEMEKTAKQFVEHPLPGQPSDACREILASVYDALAASSEDALTDISKQDEAREKQDEAKRYLELAISTREDGDPELAVSREQVSSLEKLIDMHKKFHDDDSPDLERALRAYDQLSDICSRIDGGKQYLETRQRKIAFLKDLVEKEGDHPKAAHADLLARESQALAWEFKRHEKAVGEHTRWIGKYLNDAIMTRHKAGGELQKSLAQVEAIEERLALFASEDSSKDNHAWRDTLQQTLQELRPEVYLSEIKAGLSRAGEAMRNSRAGYFGLEKRLRTVVKHELDKVKAMESKLKSCDIQAYADALDLHADYLCESAEKPKDGERLRNQAKKIRSEPRQPKQAHSIADKFQIFRTTFNKTTSRERPEEDDSRQSLE